MPLNAFANIYIACYKRNS